MKDPILIEAIKKEISQSGHSVSVRVSKILNSKGWYVQDSTRYKVNETDSMFYEIDVFATKESTFAGRSNNCLCIECKKQTGKNWVFFKQNKLNEDIYTLNCVTDDPDEYLLLDKIEKEKLFLTHHYYHKPLCTYYFISHMKPNERSEMIDKGVDQVLRAVSFYVKRNWGYTRSEFFYPIIVFDGNLFIASLDGDEIDVENCNHVSLYITREFSKPYHATTNSLMLSKPYIIDIVRLDWFETFLETSFPSNSSTD